jgi:hypothetical protein
MNKYLVRLEEKKYYVVEIEAENASDALTKAEEIDLNDLKLHDYEKEAYDCDVIEENIV